MHGCYHYTTGHRTSNSKFSDTSTHTELYPTNPTLQETQMTTFTSKRKLLRHMKTKGNHNNNRYKNKKKLYNNIRHNSNINSIVNLSDTELSTTTIGALSKGLKFIPKSKRTHNNTIYQSFLQYRRKMYLKYIFKDTNHTYRYSFKTHFTPPWYRTT